MMMYNRKMIKQTTRKEGNQETNIRGENINSKREEQSVKPQQ